MKTRPEPQIIRVLNLGAGVQSSTLYLMAVHGVLPYVIDHAVFADTGEEPAAVYNHLRWMQLLNGPPIHVRSKGKLGDDLLRGENSTKQRFATIPAFTAPAGATYKTGILRRQCTQEYKIRPIEQCIRRDICGLAPGRAVPRHIQITQYYGISTDESSRAGRITAARAGSQWKLVFPLIEMGMSRKDCIAWLEQHGNVPHVVPRSACVFCPYHTNVEWARLKAEDPESFARACEIDEGLRRPGVIMQRGMNQDLYLHPKVQPLVQIDFSAPLNPDQYEMWPGGVETQECEGMCGNLMTQQMLTFEEARQAKAAVLAEVEENNEPWMDTALRALGAILAGRDVPDLFTGEWIRMEVSKAVGAPRHPNVWGALVGSAIKRSLIERSGLWTPMRDRRSHGRQTPFYRNLVGYGV